MPLILAIQYSVLLGCVGILLGLTYFCGRYFSHHLIPQVDTTANLLCSLQKQISPTPSPKNSSSTEDNNSKENKIHETNHFNLPIDLALPSTLEIQNLAISKLEI